MRTESFQVLELRETNFERVVKALRRSGFYADVFGREGSTDHFIRIFIPGSRDKTAKAGNYIVITSGDVKVLTEEGYQASLYNQL